MKLGKQVSTGLYDVDPASDDLLLNVHAMLRLEMSPQIIRSAEDILALSTPGCASFCLVRIG